MEEAVLSTVIETLAEADVELGLGSDVVAGRPSPLIVVEVVVGAGLPSCRRTGTCAAATSRSTNRQSNANHGPKRLDIIVCRAQPSRSSRYGVARSRLEESTAPCLVEVDPVSTKHDRSRPRCRGNEA
jgi:hypothetical protein